MLINWNNPPLKDYYDKLTVVQKKIVEIIKSGIPEESVDKVFFGYRHTAVVITSTIEKLKTVVVYPNGRIILPWFNYLEELIGMDKATEVFEFYTNKKD